MMFNHISSLPAARRREIPAGRGTPNDAICDDPISHHGDSRTPVLAAYRHADHCANSQPHDFMGEHYESDSKPEETFDWLLRFDSLQQAMAWGSSADSLSAAAEESMPNFSASWLTASEPRTA